MNPAKYLACLLALVLRNWMRSSYVVSPKGRMLGMIRGSVTDSTGGGDPQLQSCLLSTLSTNSVARDHDPTLTATMRFSGLPVGGVQEFTVVGALAWVRLDLTGIVLNGSRCGECQRNAEGRGKGGGAGSDSDGFRLIQTRRDQDDQRHDYQSECES